MPIVIALITITTNVKAAPAERALLARLDKAITIQGDDQTLGQVIETVGRLSGAEIKVNWPALALVGISKDTFVWLDLKAVAAKQALQIALDQASAHAFDDDKAGFAIRDGAVLVTTLRMLKTDTEEHAYSIRKYIAAGRGKITAQEMVDRFVELIMTTVGDPDEWLDEESTIIENKGMLIIKTTPENHAQIEARFKQIDNPVDNAREIQPKENRAVQARLDKRVSLSKDELPVEVFIDFVRASADVNIVVNWTSLELVGVTRDSLITLDLQRVKTSELLRLGLDQVSADAFDDDKAGFAVRGNVAYIDTRRMLKAHTVTHVYKLSRWIGDKAGDEEAVDEVVEAIYTRVGDPDEWLDEESTVTGLFGLLIVQTTNENHLEIVKLLEGAGR